jgi:hypothetical protein
MTTHLIKVKSVNAHRSNNCVHSLLQQNDDIHILLIQEPWFYTVATMRSDTNPKGTQQKGPPLNNMWDVHLPRHGPKDTCKVAVYSKKAITPRIKLLANHPIANLNTMVLDILDDTTVTLRLINVYHEVPNHSYGLRNLLQHDLDETTPTIVLGDFNTHSYRWSLDPFTPSAWHHQLHDWLDLQGLTCLNPSNTPTWFDLSNRARPSTLDLAFINEAACFSGQIGDLLISEGPEPLTDHASLTLPFYPITSIALLPPPAPKGYKVDATRQEAWTEAFLMELRTKGTANDLTTSISNLNDAIKTASKHTLEPRRAPNPKGASWWNKACSKAQTAARTTAPGPAHKAAHKTLQQVIVAAKRDWAHEKLNHAVDAGDIWALAKLRKGRQTNAFPPLRTPDNRLVDDPNSKARIFQDKFFPANPVKVDTIQPDDLTPAAVRHWTPITTLDVTNALKTAANSSAPGPSGIGYSILKWAHAASPETLTHIFNQSLFTGVHPWKHTTVVVLNKPNKPDYSQAKAYRPISLLECTAKLMEKIITKRVNEDILRANLLSMSQFGSRPHHNAIDAAATLIHRI